MAYGLRVYNSSGLIAIDVSDRLTRFVSSHTTNLNNSSQDIYVTGLVNDGTWAAWADNMYASVRIFTGYFTVQLLYVSGAVTVNVLRV